MEKQNIKKNQVGIFQVVTFWVGILRGLLHLGEVWLVRIFLLGIFQVGVFLIPSVWFIVNSIKISNFISLVWTELRFPVFFPGVSEPYLVFLP